jgi:hypothetical protein
VIIATLVLTTACERSEPVPGRKDTVIPVAPPPDSATVVPPVPSAWDSSAGPALFIVGPSPSEAIVIAAAYTDSASLDRTRIDDQVRSIQIDLFAGGQRAGTARVNAVAAPVRSDSCTSWPVARLVATITDSSAFSSWTVGFESGHATEVALDSIAALPTADSSRLAVDIARIASALPGDTAAMFRGLPFVVKKAWRSRGLQPQVLAAIIVRNVNQEANPHQEQLLLVAERDTTSTVGSRYTPVYYERVTGLEETIETTDLIGMVRVGVARTLTIVVARDAASGSSYALIERVGRRWQRRWTSTYAGC